jgi:predicted permease
MGAFLADLKYGLRMLVKHPGLASISILALGVGLGLTTTMWSIVYGAMLRGLPFDDGKNIMSVQRTNPEKQIRRGGIVVQDYDEFVRSQTSFSEFGAYYTGTVNVSGSAGRPERFSGGYMTPGSLPLLRVRPTIGRFFTEDEGTIGGAMTVILGNDVWRNRFSADPQVIGRTIRVNGSPAEIVGVMPRGFKFPNNEDLWLPLRIDRLKTTRTDGMRLQVIGRLKPGVTRARAMEDFTAIENRLAQEYPVTNAGFKPLIESFTDTVIGPEPRTMLWTMMGAVLAVLLIACSNVANLLLARAAVRTKEVAVRTALGASRWRIVSQLLAEALVLSSAGALLGLGIAEVGVRMFVNAIADSQPPFWIRIAVDGPVLLFVTGLTMLSSLIAGVLPALQATGTRIHEVLKDESRGSSSLRLGRFSKGLVVAEIALSCGLLIGAGFMIQSVVQRDHFDYGIPTRSIFTARVGLFESTFPDSVSRRLFWDELLRRVEQLPGQQGVTLMSNLPGVGSGTEWFALEGKTYAHDRDRPEVRTAAVTPGYFGTFKLRALEGRLFNDGDRLGSRPVAIVTRNFATKYFAGSSALGRTLRLGGADTKEPWLTIVGVIPDVWYQGTNDDTPEALLRPIAQGDWRFLSVAVAAVGDPLAFTEPVRTAVAGLNPDQPIYFVRTLQKAIDDNGWFYSVFGGLFVVFGFAALVLAAIGVYGVMSFAVTRRTQEIGVRMALGAGARQVMGLFLRQGALQVGAGLVVGLGLAVLLSKGLATVLFQVNTKNPLMFAAVMAALGITGIVAVLIPAQRATRIDPLMALRYD